MMDISTMSMVAVAVAANIIVIKVKIEKLRHSDALLDTLVLITLALLFKNSVTGLVIATISSAIFSIYLMFSPPKFDISKLIK